MFYNDTHFHIGEINTQKDIEDLKIYIKRQNQLIQIIIFLIIVILTYLFIKIWYIYGFVFLLASLIYIIRQSENKDRLSCVSITRNIDDFYILNLLARQSSKESLIISENLLYQYIQMNHECENVYCANELLMNMIMNPAYDYYFKKRCMLYKLDEIINQHNNESYLYQKKFRNTLDIEKRVFYENFDLLMIMGYWFQKNDDNENLQRIIDYVDFMLKKVFEEDVSDNIFELQIIREGYYEYEDAFQNMCNGVISFKHHKINEIRYDFEYRKKIEKAFVE